MVVEDTEVEVAIEGEGAGGDLSFSTFWASEEYGSLSSMVDTLCTCDTQSAQPMLQRPNPKARCNDTLERYHIQVSNPTTHQT